MDYGGILNRAWQITWRYKILWLFGFFLGSGSGGFIPFHQSCLTTKPA